MNFFVIGRSFSPKDFNLYVFQKLKWDFHDLMTIIFTKAKPISYSDLHNHLLTHEFIHKASFQATTSYGLYITWGSSLSLHSFTNANWADSIDDLKSTSGCFMYLGTTLMSWKSRKQHIIARSSIEAKYKTLTDDTVEIL